MAEQSGLTRKTLQGRGEAQSQGLAVGPRPGCSASSSHQSVTPCRTATLPHPPFHQ